MYLLQECILVLCIQSFFLVSECAHHRFQVTEVEEYEMPWERAEPKHEKKEVKSGGKTTLYPVGCYVSSKSSRALPKHIITFIDEKSHLFGGKDLPFEKRISLCQKKAEELGFSFIGIESLGECYAGHELKSKYDASSKDCINPHKKCCTLDDKICVGKANTIFIYELVRKPSTLAIGCFKDKTHFRVLKKLVRTYRDKSSHVYAGSSINWKHFSVFIRKMVMECYNIATKNGYKYFGVEFYGECWAGNKLHSSKVNYPDKCVDDGYKRCAAQYKFCAGKASAIFVYEILYK